MTPRNADAADVSTTPATQCRKAICAVRRTALPVARSITDAVALSSSSVDCSTSGALPDHESRARHPGQQDPEAEPADSHTGHYVDPRPGSIASMARGSGAGGGPPTGNHRTAVAASLVADGPAPSERMRKVAAEKARLAEVWHKTPMGKDGSHDVLAPWVDKRPYWASMLQQVVIELRHGTADTELIKQMDSKVIHLIKAVQALPLPEKRRVAANLCERLRSERSRYGQEQQRGTRLRRFMEFLDQGGEDCHWHDTAEADD